MVLEDDGDGPPQKSVILEAINAGLKALDGGSQRIGYVAHL